MGVFTSKMKERSLQDVLLPLQEYGKAYEKVEADYSTLLAQAEAWKNKAEQENNPEAYAMYQRYAHDLRAITNDLANNGLNNVNRSSLLGMKGRYMQEIQPIADAYTRREELAKEQREMLSKDPTRLFQRMASNMSLDEFIRNPSADYGANISGSLVSQQASNQAKNLAKELKAYGLGRAVDAYTNTFIKKYGLTSEQVRAFVANPTDATNPVLKAIYDDTMNATGVKEWNDPGAVSKVGDYIAQGLWDAIGQADVTTIDNYGAKMALQLQNQKDMWDYEVAHPKPTTKTDTTSGNGGGTPDKDNEINLKSVALAANRTTQGMQYNNFFDKESKALNDNGYKYLVDGINKRYGINKLYRRLKREDNDTASYYDKVNAILENIQSLREKNSLSSYEKGVLEELYSPSYHGSPTIGFTASIPVDLIANSLVANVEFVNFSEQITGKTYKIKDNQSDSTINKDDSTVTNTQNNIEKIKSDIGQAYFSSEVDNARMNIGYEYSISDSDAKDVLKNIRSHAVDNKKLYTAKFENDQDGKIVIKEGKSIDIADLKDYTPSNVIAFGDKQVMTLTKEDDDTITIVVPSTVHSVEYKNAGETNQLLSDIRQSVNNGVLSDNLKEYISSIIQSSQSDYLTIILQNIINATELTQAQKAFLNTLASTLRRSLYQHIANEWVVNTTDDQKFIASDNNY